MRVILVAHAVGAGLGSEPGIGFGWADSLSRMGHEVYVICHPEYRARNEAYLELHPNSNLEICYVSLRPWLDPWNPANGEKWIRLHYLGWLGAAYHAAEKLNQRVKADVIHHVNLGSVLPGSPFHRLSGCRFIWGPLGGAQLTPKGFEAYARDGAARRFQVAAIPYLPHIRSTAQRAALVLATNGETKRALKAAGARRVDLMPDGGTREVPYRLPPRRDTLQLLWAGRLEPRKALPLALEALAAAGPIPVKLRVAGNGPMEFDWDALSDRLGLASRVEFLGRVAPENMPALFGESDVFVFTSLRDTFGTVVLEAMSHGLPVITLDHQGVGAHLPDGAAIKVPVTVPRETIAGLADGIRLLQSSPVLVRNMGQAAWAWSQLNSWENRAKTMTRLYEGVVSV